MKKIAFFYFFFLIIFTSFNSEETWRYNNKKGFPDFRYPQKYTITKAGISLGEKLFFERQLSVDSSIACASCHKPEFAFGDNKSFSLGVNNQILTRNTLPLFNLNWYNSFFWDGRVRSIEEQISHPIMTANEMGSNWKLILGRLNNDKEYLEQFKSIYKVNRIDSNYVVYSIAQFLNTLISDNSKFDKVLAKKASFTKDEYEGYELLNDQSYSVACMHCHTTEGSALTTNLSFSNNGIDSFTSGNLFSDKGLYYTTLKQTDIGRFKVPSLRNLKYTAPYMHDGRFKTLEEVIDFYSKETHASFNLDSRIHSNEGKEVFTNIEKRKIVAFLNTLNDYDFIKNPAYRVSGK